MPTRPMNVLLFAIDSLRADHMSCYGYHRLTTPYMDAFAQESVLFENCYSAYIPTTPAYTSIFTGMDVMSHEMVALGPKGPIDPKIHLMPELLRELGYASVRVGFGGEFFRGFDRMLSYDEGWRAWEDRPARKAENLNEVAIPALEELVRSGQPWLLFMRHMDPHAPYLPPPPYDHLFYSKDPTEPGLDMSPIRDFPNFADFHLSWMPPGIQDANHPIAMYDGAVAYMDACIQRILTRLDELGQRENTLVIITADHGETLYDHGCYFDHHGLYEPTLHVPLIVRFPDGSLAGERIPGYVLHQDLLPSLLDILGAKRITRRERMDGKSWIPLLTGERATNYTEFYITECTWMRKRGWRTTEWKLIEALEPDFHGKPPVELYNLVSDPEEQENLAEKEPKVVQWLKDRMMRWVNKRLKQTGKPDPILQYELGLNKRIGSIAVAQKLQDR
ncbi:MAG: sulfatase family protein [Chthonomonadales bacterium]